jgi:peptide/nickel transport system permease protein
VRAIAWFSEQSGASGLYWRGARQLLRHRLGRAGLAVALFVLVVAMLGPLIAPYDPNEVRYDAALTPPSGAHWLGTDEIGRDVLSRIILGARVSLQVTLISVVGALLAGGFLGMVSGYVGGRVDSVIMRIMDGMLAFPMLVLALAIVAVLGPDLVNAIIAIAIVNIPSFARLVRAQVLSIRQSDFVHAARGLGASDLRIMRVHIWPSLAGSVIVYASLRASAALITESSLAFLGLGAQPPTPSWGQMLSTAIQYGNAWWLSVFPGLAIFVSVLSLNFLGDGLRDALDSRIDE